MPSVTLKNVALRGIVCSVPGKALSVADIGSAFPLEEAEKVAKLSGIETLYRAKPGQTTSDLCVAAAKHLLEGLNWPPESIEGVIVVTQTPDYILPNDASVVHAVLGLSKSCFAFDVAMGCSGFVYGYWIASQFVSGGSAKRVLLLVGDTLSQVASPQDRSSLLFGDAGAAAALEWDPAAEPSSFVLGSDGRGVQSLIIPAGGFRDRGGGPESYTRVTDPEGNARSPREFYMDGWEVFNFTIREVPGLVQTTLAQHGWTKDELDWVLFHQANKMIVQHLARKIGVQPQKAPINIQRYGNTSGVSIPLLLADDIGDSISSAPQKVLLLGFGVGYAWAGAALTIGPVTVSRVVHVLQE
ncbi:MAG: ketoacyl-ACP synthase III [Firmicutes bacterium]|nr:ketoacyl-ACP synthase III [Bacillota bacterium]